MRDKFINQIKSLQEQLEGEREKLSQRISSERNRLVEERERLTGEGERLVATARQQARRVRGESQEKFWTAETSALGQALDLLARTDELPETVQKATEPLENLVRQRFEDITASPVEDYAGLNAKDAVKSLRELGWLDLVKLRRIESEGKSRKTVLSAIETGLQRQLVSNAA